MKRSLLQILSIAVILAFLMPVITNAQGGKANFAGSWVYNAEKSNTGQPQGGGGGGQGGGMRMGGGTLTIKQEANLLQVDRTRNNQDGQPVTVTEKYTLDGKESVNTGQRGDSKSVATWAADGKSLNISTTRNFNGNDVTSKAAWTIEGNTLIITTTMASQDGGTRTIKAVYDKK